MKRKFSNGWWNYRFCENIVNVGSTDEVYYNMIEVYYDKDGNILAWDDNTSEVYVESKKDAKILVEQIKKASEAKLVTMNNGKLVEIDKYMKRG